jgi:4-hydroxy-L-threonine phosphate dehydrogenase PdxA
MTRPILALTMGDPVGVGPEILVLALSDPRPWRGPGGVWLRKCKSG